jgi:hypothetical protein
MTSLDVWLSKLHVLTTLWMVTEKSIATAKEILRLFSSKRNLIGDAPKNIFAMGNVVYSFQ